LNHANPSDSEDLQSGSNPGRRTPFGRLPTDVHLAALGELPVGAFCDERT
jgi:hypothetical protein